MKYQNTRRGFTLIELLVVVLMIGILGAVALPQYHKAVDKSRVTQCLVYLRTISQAHYGYYLQNGKYARDIRDLDIELPQVSAYKKGSWTQDSDNVSAYFDGGSNCGPTRAGGSACKIQMPRNKGIFIYTDKGRYYCFGYDTYAAGICRSLAGANTSSVVSADGTYSW